MSGPSADTIRLAVESVTRDGVAALSLRSIAGAAGVTPAPVYRHFESREANLDEVVRFGFEELSRVVEGRVSGRTALDRFVTSAVGYIEFAGQYPRLFSLMFATEGSGERDLVAQDKTRPENQLRIHLRIYLGKKNCDMEYFQAWGLAHGLASLVANGLCGFGPEDCPHFP